MESEAERIVCCMFVDSASHHERKPRSKRILSTPHYGKTVFDLFSIKVRYWGMFLMKMKEVHGRSGRFHQ